MIKIVESIYIEASPEKIWDYLINPSNLPKYWPNIAKITDIKELPNEGYITRWFYRMGPFQFTGTGETVDCARGQYIVDHIKGGVNSVQKWTLSPKDTGTMAVFAVEYSIPIPLIGSVLEKLLESSNRRDGEQMMKILKSIIEEHPAT